MEHIPTGSATVNTLFQYPKDGITLIYGEGGSGKTTLCLMAAIEQILQKKKVIFLDAEKNFSIERLEQLAQHKNIDKEYMLVLPSKNFNVQHTQIKMFEDINNIGLIIIDSLTHFYRRLHAHEPDLAEGMLNKQVHILDNLAKKNVPIILTSQVYTNFENEIVPLARAICARYAKTVIKLEKKPRTMILEKPELKSKVFVIKNEGIELI